MKSMFKSIYDPKTCALLPDFSLESAELVADTIAKRIIQEAIRLGYNPREVAEYYSTKLGLEAARAIVIRRLETPGSRESTQKRNRSTK